MDTRNPSKLAELDRRTLLKGAAAGIAGAGVAGASLAARPAAAQDKKALEDAQVATETVRFKAGADTINGFLARPRGDGKHGAVILIPGIFGVDHYIKETAAQVAQAGLVGLALNFYSRAEEPVPADFAQLREFVGKHAPDRQIVTDAQAAIDYLKQQPYTNGKFGLTGFCMGGRITLLVAAHSPDIRAAAPFYGPLRAAGPTNIAPMEHVEKIKAPVQGHYGALDMNPRPEDVQEFYAKLKQTNPHVEFFLYEGAGHAFHTFDRAQAYRPEAALLAWSRTLEFMQKHLR
jgi:carboxymethylenebutenolidase